MSGGLSDLQKQLLGTFFEEAGEALEQFESGLLALEAGGGDAQEQIDAVFRAAHSLKGGAATFGLIDIAEVSHVAETLLDRLRSGRCVISPEVTSILLESVDVLRELLTVALDGSAKNAEGVIAIKRRLERAIVVSSVPPARSRKPGKPETPAALASSHAIVFRPHAHMLETGNDAVRLLRELSLLGAYRVTADLGGLPPFSELEPTRSYLGWTVTLDGSATPAQIQEIFSWVDDAADIEVRTAPLPLAQPPVPSASRSEPVLAERAQPIAAERDVAIGSIRVSVDKVDLLMNMVGELVITQSMLGELDSDGPIDAARLASLRDGLSLLARNTRALQESVMNLRSMPVGAVFARLPRMVHDVSRQLGKRVELRMSGQTTEVDKTILEKLGDPLVHLIRNSLDHGIESSERRRAAGKPEVGLLEVRAYHRGGDIVVELSDDGGGLDLAKILARGRERGLVARDETPSDDALRELIFAPGFSTAAEVSDVSGRGVGMDVVRRNIKSLGGHIQVHSVPGQGTRISLRLPLTLAIIDGQLVSVANRTYVIPLLSILESVQVEPARVNRLEGKTELYRLRDDLVPMVDVRTILGLPPIAAESGQRLMVVVETEVERIGLLVDELLAQQQVVVKSLETNYGAVAGLAGATILGDGRVALILDVIGLASLARRRGAVAALSSAA
jgi:two-component system, chemotaxis family, sensor kinase CheA